MFAKLRLFFAGLCIVAVLSGCGRGVQSDLKITNFNVDSTGARAKMTGTVENTGQNTYSAVFIVLDLYDGDQFAKRIETSANLFANTKFVPGQRTSFDKDFDDGGFRPNRYEVVRLYGVQ
jgi:hypothetical protein